MHFLVSLLTLALAATPTPTPSAAPLATICNKYCDARDPASSPGDREGPSAGVGGLGSSGGCNT